MWTAFGSPCSFLLRKRREANPGLGDQPGRREQDDEFAGCGGPRLFQASARGALRPGCLGRRVTGEPIDPDFETAVEADDQGFAEGGDDVALGLADGDGLPDTAYRDFVGSQRR